MLYPLKFTPQLLPKIWGGNSLKPWYRFLSSGLENVGEAWVMSADENFPTVVENGFLAGNNLSELLEIYMSDLVGEKVFDVFGNTFPLLIKFIDAADDLSVQVHPNDEQSFEKEGKLGKTEMWYVMPGTSSDAAILQGWKHPTTSNDVRKASQDGSILSLMDAHPVMAGDVALLEAGTVHALKKGCVVAEIQENSDVTYRLFDYNRTDNMGKKRELHLEDALDVLNYGSEKNAFRHPEPVLNGAINLATTPYFTTNLLSANTIVERDYAPLDSFVIYICVEGEAEVTAFEADTDASIRLCQGEAALLPAALNDIQIRPIGGEVKLLEAYIE